ncbi:unnamed protein product [Caenorhabditis angaria]|uniref:Glycosyltransferase family 92 protein n=1 Tax=Caenorhabditis angaria TaxID=860376 RepID=A0A9P1J0P9_9PELO|nr:unnamed protein product [Caenorhabditis angaria]
MHSRFSQNEEDRLSSYLVTIGCMAVLFGWCAFFSGLLRASESSDSLKNTHAFIHSAYYYENSKSLGKNALALVMSINKLTAENILDMKIRFLATNDRLERFPVEATLTSEHDFRGSCEYVTVLAQANTIDNMELLEIEGNDKVIDQVSFKKPLETSPSKVVFCVAPQLAAENWQEFLRQVHVAKRYGAHLHIYVISMVEKYFRLMKEYESLGYISLEPWLTVKYSHVQEVYMEKPNRNIEILQKTAAFTDCILNYKEAAEFVGSIEMEDLLIPIGSTSYYEEFEKQYGGNEFYSGLIYARQMLFISQESENSVSLSRIFQKTTPGDVNSYGRSFVRTSNYNSTWLHWSRNSDRKTYHKKVEGCRMFNFRKSETINQNESEIIIDEKILGEIEGELQHHLELPQIKAILPELPVSEVYTTIISKCLEQLTSRYSPETTVCMDMYKCELPIRRDLPCIHSDGQYSSTLPMKPITFHYSSHHFFTRHLGCNI